MTVANKCDLCGVFSTYETWNTFKDFDDGRRVKVAIEGVWVGNREPEPGVYFPCTKTQHLCHKCLSKVFQVSE